RWHAIFDHANIGESEPCMTAGACEVPWSDAGGLNPSDLIQDNPGQEAMMVERELIETFNLDHELKTCQRHMSEFLKSTLRGLEFKHMVSKSSGDLPFEACLELQKL